MAVNWGKIFGILNGIAFGDNEDAGIGEDAGVMIFRKNSRTTGIWWRPRHSNIFF